METYNICTIAGEKYIIKALALYKSLYKVTKNFNLWILSMDANSYKILSLSNFENINIIQLKQIEDNNLLEIKQQRKINEYCWTLKAPLIKYVQESTNNQDVLYVDSDIYFFKDPYIIFQSLKKNSIYLSPQNDLDFIEHKYGKFQAGLIGFKGDWEGKAALNWWENKCLQWCKHEYDPIFKRYGDQKYLDEIPYLFKSVKIEDNYGVNAAPWNSIYNKERSIDISKSAIKINNNEIICFHFSCISIYNLQEYDLWSLGNIEIPEEIIKALYIPYIKNIVSVAKNLIQTDPTCIEHIFINESSLNAVTYFKYNELTLHDVIQNIRYNLCSIVSYKYIIRAIVLYTSLNKYSKGSFHIWFCAIDKDTYNILTELNLENATIVNVNKVTEGVLKNIRIGRNQKEYCWTLKSIFVDYLLRTYEVKSMLYCDADMYFFTHIKYIYQEWGDSSFLLCTQRSNEKLEFNCGYYQAGLLGFKNDYYAKKILTWWKEKCINWCYDDYDYKLSRWGDQKYLDKIPEFFDNIKVSQNLGINAAPWNLILNNKLYSISYNDLNVCINNYILCAYHFGSMNIFDNENFDLWSHSPVKIEKEIIEYIYNPYIICINKVVKDLETMGINVNKLFDSGNIEYAKNYYKLGRTIYG